MVQFVCTEKTEKTENAEPTQREFSVFLICWRSSVGLEHLSDTQEVDGSSPSVNTKSGQFSEN